MLTFIKFQMRIFLNNWLSTPLVQHSNLLNPLIMNNKIVSTETRPCPISPAPKVLDSTQLFASHRELTIVHHGESYRLRETRNGKLILTK